MKNSANPRQKMGNWVGSQYQTNRTMSWFDPPPYERLSSHLMAKEAASPAMSAGERELGRRLRTPRSLRKSQGTMR